MPKHYDNILDSLILKQEKHPDKIVAELVEKTGVKYSSIYQYRLNNVMMKASTALLIAEYFKISVEELFGRQNPYLGIKEAQIEK